MPRSKTMPDPVRRNTRQREAIRSVFHAHDRPLSPQEVLEYAQAQVAGLGIATVYRNLRLLVNEKWLTPVEMPGGAVLYERSGKSHHHHFQCESCHRVFELEGCPPAIRRLGVPGFQVRRHELILYGICAACGKRRRA